MSAKPLFWALLLVLPATAALAQTKHQPAKPSSKPATTIPGMTEKAPESSVIPRVEKLTANMTEALGLTPAQVEKVRAINLNSVRTVETARLNHADEPAKLRTYIESVGQARLEQLKDVLTPPQFMKYQQKREEKMGIPTVRGNQGNRVPAPNIGGGRSEDQ
ncbi:MAG: hypothetical protein ACRYFX_28010 [Janthinobacterium lividum]